MVGAPGDSVVRRLNGQPPGDGGLEAGEPARIRWYFWSGSGSGSAVRHGAGYVGMSGDWDPGEEAVGLVVDLEADRDHRRDSSESSLFLYRTHLTAVQSLRLSAIAARRGRRLSATAMRCADGSGILTTPMPPPCRRTTVRLVVAEGSTRLIPPPCGLTSRGLNITRVFPMFSA